MKQLLSITLKNQPDALMRLMGVVYRRGFAVESLSVTPAYSSDFACVQAIVTDCSPASCQLVQQIRKLVHVERAELLPLKPGI